MISNLKLFFLLFASLVIFEVVLFAEDSVIRNKHDNEFIVKYDESDSDKSRQDVNGGTKHVVVVTGTRSKKRLKDSPVITEVISKQEIHDSRADTLGDIMEDYGLQFMNNSMGNYIRLQGMEADKVLFLVDGRRISGRIAKRLDASTIPVSNIERIEIVRGPQSLLYGSDGIGGVINIITKKPKEGISINGKISNSFVDLSDNDDCFLMQNGQAIININSGHFYSMMHANISRSDYVLSGDEQFSVSPRYQQGMGGIVLGVTPSSMLDINFGGDFFKRQSDNRTSRYGSYERIETTRVNGFIDVAYDRSDRLSFSGKFYCNYYLRDKDKYSALTGEWENSEHKEEADLYVAEAFSAVALTKNNTLLVGVETLFDSLSKYNIGNDVGSAKKKRDRFALIVQDEQSVKNSYAVLGGVRIERDSVFGYFVSPKVSAMRYFSKTVRALGGVGVGYRAPSFSDLYLNKSDNPSHPVILGNDDLRSEKSIGSNIGIEVSHNKRYFTINFFHNELFDEIVNDLQDYKNDGRDVYIRSNMNRTVRSGFDCEGKIGLVAYLTLSAGYNFVVGYDRHNEKMIKDQPVHTLRGRMMFKHQTCGFIAYINARYQSDIEDLENDEIVVMNFYMSKEFFDQTKVFLSVENFTDVTDRDIGLGAGRIFTVGMEAWY